MRILLAQINPTVGDLAGNTNKILQGISCGRSEGAGLVVFPELALSGYPPEDFLLLPHFIEAVNLHLSKVVEAAKDIAVIVGIPRINPVGKEKFLCNSAAIIDNQTLMGFQDKILLPTYDVFDERRYFEPGSKATVWKIKGKKVGITICEDIWKNSVKAAHYQKDPMTDLAPQKPDFLVNISASPFRMKKCSLRLEVCSETALELQCPVLLCNQVGGDDSLIFDGYSLYVNPQGKLLQHAKGFDEDFMLVDLDKEMKPHTLEINNTEDLFKALVLGVRDYFHKLGLTKACLGISGGIDSAIVACIAEKALGKENVLGLIMPSRYSSESGMIDSTQLINNLGIQSKTISIEKPFQCYLDLLEPHFEGRPFDTTEENLQARIRGMILMAFSNKFRYVVLSTGNKSELAMGYATLYGDMCGGLGVLSDVIKNHVYALARWINRTEEIIPENILSKPPSAELCEGQLDSDSLPDYEIVDTVTREYVEKFRSPEDIAKEYGYPLPLVKDLVKRIHLNEYKRRQSPTGLRVSERAFSKGRHFPIAQRWV
ncbi:MAG: NAD+ synthase [Waddliaceae bacterium]